MCVETGREMMKHRDTTTCLLLPCQGILILYLDVILGILYHLGSYCFSSSYIGFQRRFIYILYTIDIIIIHMHIALGIYVPKSRDIH